MEKSLTICFIWFCFKYFFPQIGAASKGIIQRDFQHHATVFKSPYAKNPFDSVSNDELEEYKRIIDKKNKGETSPEPVIEDPGDTTDPGIVFTI